VNIFSQNINIDYRHHYFFHLLLIVGSWRKNTKMIKVIFVFSSVGNLQGFAIVTREIMNMTINTIGIVRWGHVISMGFFFGLFQGWNQNFKVKNRWKLIQNINYCHLLLGINEVIRGLRSLIRLWFGLIWKGFFIDVFLYDNCTFLWVFNMVFLVENGGICHQRPWREEVTILCFYNWSPLHVPIHFVGIGGIFHDSNDLMRNCSVLDVCSYVTCMMMWRPKTW
jgi:hypothetical protein